MPPLLRCEGLTKYYDGLPALKDVTLEVAGGEILGVIGPNGAGKTTLFNIISGLLKPTRGRVLLEGVEITGLPPHRVHRMGVSRTFQVPRPLPELSVAENVALGLVAHGVGRGEALQRSLTILSEFGMADRAWRPAGQLNAQERKTLELCRALVHGPKLLLIDEYVGGLSPLEVDRAVQALQRIRVERQVTVLWIEHVLRAVMSAADRVVVLNYGEKIAEGPPREVARDPRVIDAYIGRGP